MFCQPADIGSVVFPEELHTHHSEDEYDDTEDKGQIRQTEKFVQMKVQQ